ncbi:methyltransferase domain-containing protein [Pseudoneurospora amorphoporcata]|uniref:Methyltransferase domain-containing protein n=1 Tax=Pseudoneurospora amorphoporcata TaxID=241081 RepID=A0AAN6SGE7_9PEZI|nr:methyltransferase domain-containing protein [Pseudoneurospora amorphoporcata]
MLPTPDTSHVPYNRVYEPAEDSFLLLDTLSSPSETAFLSSRFCSTSPSSPSPPNFGAPLVLEVGPGSGVVIAFLTAHASTIFGTPHVLTTAIDVSPFACAATNLTVRKAVSEAEAEAEAENPSTSGQWTSAIQGDLVSPLRPGSVDVLVFNPPYVPTPGLPAPPPAPLQELRDKTTFEEDSHLLELTYAGGKDGMETTDRLIDALPGVLSERGVAYILLCAQNKPEDVKGRIRSMGTGTGEGEGWKAETVGTSGKQAGWEKLQIVRVWR